MKCAKCGHEVPDSAPSCPWCAAGKTSSEKENSPEPHCPICGSSSISAVRKGYDPGCGCLGLLLFSWLGLLLGLIGAGEIDHVCNNCGATWPAERRNPGSGCSLLLWLLILSALLCFFLR